MLRTDVADGQGPLIRGCQNVSAADRTQQFMVGAYLTTWSSVDREFNAYALSGALLANTSRQQIERERSPSETFCRAFRSDKEHIVTLVVDAFKQVGYRVLYAEAVTGVVATDYVDQSHAAAWWKDRYLVTLEGAADGQTVVRVIRDVYISRPGSRRGEWTPYVKAESVGHNEAWLLNRITQQLQAVKGGFR